VWDFGAIPSDWGNDTPAIQDAIDTAFACGGGEVFFPPGEFETYTQLVIPRSTVWANGLTFRGMGPNVSSLSSSTALSSSIPLIRYADGNQAVGFHHWEGLTLARSNEGTVFEHTSPGVDPYLNKRAMWLKMERMVFRSAPGSSTSPDVLHLGGLLQANLEDIVVSGGGTGIHLAHSSHVTFTNLTTFTDGQVTTGLKVTGGGNLEFIGTRINSTSGGPNVILTGGARNVHFAGLWSEGDDGNVIVDIPDAKSVLIDNPAVATAETDGSYGIRVGSLSRNVVIRGGGIADMTIDGNNPNSRAIKVEDGAMWVKIENIEIYGKGADNVTLGTTADDVLVDLMDTSVDQKFSWFQ
jgi:hypothetical protein